MNKIGFFISVNDNIYYKNHQEVCNLFGIKSKEHKVVTSIDKNIN